MFESAFMPCQKGDLGRPWWRLLLPFVFARIASLQCPSLGYEQVVLMWPNFTFHLCVQQYPVVSHTGLVGLQLEGRSCPGQCSVDGLPSFNLAMAAVRLAIIFACCWFVATSMSMVLFFWMDVFAKLLSNAAIFSAWTIFGAVIGKGQVAGGHAVDVAHLHERGCPVNHPVVPCVIREGMVSPLLSCESHVPTVESMFGPGCGHHLLGDGYTSILSKHLALLLLVHVDGKGKVRIDSLVEIGDVVFKIRLADLGVSSTNVGDNLL